MHNLMKSLIIAFIAAISVAFGAMAAPDSTALRVGAERTELFYPILKGKKIGLLTNQTGRVGNKMTVDAMRGMRLNVSRIFTPEHGLRGTADAGQKVANSIDRETGIKVMSLYGPKVTDAAIDAAVRDLDAIVVDLQDVGTRFYTYYITMLRLMNSAARQEKEFIVLDRPNPNGMYVDGPILDRKLYSGVGRLPIPIVHGMTLGELAKMIVGEKWLDNRRGLALTVVPCANYTHSTRYSLPVKPSPNLASDLAVALYPSLCYFEGTPVSVGRGTDNPFTLYGHPELTTLPDTFTPEPREGATKPPCANQLCHGRDLSGLSVDEAIARGVDFSYVIEAYKAWPVERKNEFFTNFFNLLAGNRRIRQMIELGKSADEIKASWAADVERFKKSRQPYLIYPE